MHTDVDVISFFTAYGTICFAYNGHPCFPTFQSDMKNPKQFGKALILGYLSKSPFLFRLFTCFVPDLYLNIDLVYTCRIYLGISICLEVGCGCQLTSLLVRVIRCALVLGLTKFGFLKKIDCKKIHVLDRTPHLTN